jgi:hypothetical protein
MDGGPPLLVYGRGRWLVPGLVDLPASVANGITTELPDLLRPAARC